MESTMLSNVSKPAFEFNITHRCQGIRAQSILDQFHSLARQTATLNIGTQVYQPHSYLFPSENFSPLGKTTRCIYKPAGRLQTVVATAYLAQ